MIHDDDQPSDGGKRSVRAFTLVVNPKAGAGRALALAAPVESALRSTGLPTSVVHATSPEHATVVAASAGPDDVLVSLGGDGLLSLLAAGALRSGAVLAPLPAGRGNDFARALGIQGPATAVAARLMTATERRVDVGLVGDRPFLGVVSVGYDAMANAVANKRTGVRGSWVYVVGGVMALVNARAHPLTVTLDEQGAPTLLRGWNVAVGNSGRHGGGLQACPGASLTDGRLDVVVAISRSRSGFVAHLVQMLRGRHTARADAWTRTVRSVRLDGPPDLVVFADGDPVGGLPVQVRVEPAALRVLV